MKSIACTRFALLVCLLTTVLSAASAEQIRLYGKFNIYNHSDVKQAGKPADNTRWLSAKNHFRYKTFQILTDRNLESGIDETWIIEPDSSGFAHRIYTADHKYCLDFEAESGEDFG